MRPALLALAVLPTIAYGQVQWERSITYPIAEFVTMAPLGASADGSVHYIGRSGSEGKSLWSFTSAGQFIQRRALPDLGNETKFSFAIGRFGDAYASSGRLVRFNLATGSEIWSVDAPSDAELIVDPSGDVFVVSPSKKQTVRRSVEDGRSVWNSPLVALAPNGTNMLATEGTSILMISPQTGAILWRQTLLPTPIGRLYCGSFTNGRALLIDAVGQAYGYRPGLTYQSLGKLSTPLTGRPPVLSASDAVALLSQSGMSGFDSNFQKIWQRPEVFALGVTGNLTVAQGKLIDLKTGSSLRQFSTVNDGFVHNGAVWNTFGVEYNDLNLRRHSIATGALLTSFHANELIEGAGEIVTGAVLPDGDLLLLDENFDKLRLIRVGADGSLRFATLLPMSYAGHHALTLTKDGRFAFVTYVSGTAKTLQVDLLTGLIAKEWSGQVIAKGDYTYRAPLSGGYTSKFDLSGREIWRIPRSGFLAIGDDGSVYAGNTKNRAADGSRLWTATAGTNRTYPVGSGVLQERNQIYRWLDSKTGATLWERYLPNEAFIDGERRDLEVRREGTSLFLRRGWDSSVVFELDVATGATKSTGLWGFWDSAGGFYRVTADREIVKLANFSANQGVNVGNLSFTSRTFVGDGKGTTYIIGMNATGVPGNLWIARYLTPN